MATHKVIQDIEAEDKLLGPLSLRQFLYAVITIACAAIAFKLMTVQWYIAIPFIPPIILFGILAAPFVGGQQPSEVWLLAKIRYFILPRVKIWNQSGVLELVTVTAPKNTEPDRTDGLNQYEVKSRLKTLAKTLDSRGWAVKNVNLSVPFDQPTDWTDDSDRLLNPMGVQTNDVLDIHDSDDVLDDSSNNFFSQSMDELITNSGRQQKKRIDQMMKNANQTPSTTQPIPQNNAAQSQIPVEPKVTLSQSDAADLSLLENQKIEDEKRKMAFANMQAVAPRNKIEKIYAQQEESKKAQAMTAPITPDILNLAHNDDLNVDVIARQANLSLNREVVVELHHGVANA